MARTVTDKRKTIEVPGLENIISEICKGDYILVLGSEIMLDKNLNDWAQGDSAKFFLESILKKKRLKEVDEDTGKHVETFPELIIANSLKTAAVRKLLIDEISTTEFDLEDINPDLIKLLRTKCFRMVLTTVIDPSVETLMDEVWGKDNYRKMSILNPKESDFDFRQEELLGDEYYDVPPTLYYLFGKADPLREELKFVLDDNDTIDCISRWLSNEVPSKLLSYLDTKKLMVLGCNLKDWCFRFFWYALRHKTETRLTRGDIALLLDTDKSEQDKNLHTYLTKNIGINIRTDARAYIHKLVEKLDETIVADRTLTLSNYGGAFISYAGEDFNIAWNVFTRLREAGVNVWLDHQKLDIGNSYDKRIQNAISNCKVFIPILSPTVASDLSENRDRYYMKEWEMATGENSVIAYYPICVMGYDHRKSYHQKVPQKIKDVTVFDWSKEPLKSFVSKIESTLKG